MRDRLARATARCGSGAARAIALLCLVSLAAQASPASAWQGTASGLPTGAYPGAFPAPSAAGATQATGTQTTLAPLPVRGAVPTGDVEASAHDYRGYGDIRDIERLAVSAPRGRFDRPVAGTRLPPLHHLPVNRRLGDSVVSLASGRRLGGGYNTPSPEAVTYDPRSVLDNPRLGEVDPRDAFDAHARQLDKPTSH